MNVTLCCTWHHTDLPQLASLLLLLLLLLLLQVLLLLLQVLLLLLLLTGYSAVAVQLHPQAPHSLPQAPPAPH
jgi:hypothetical protein